MRKDANHTIVVLLFEKTAGRLGYSGRSKPAL
jgi:hypothetical protein